MVGEEFAEQVAQLGTRRLGSGVDWNNVLRWAIVAFLTEKRPNWEVE